MSRIALAALLLVAGCAQARPAPGPRPALLKDWALARCLTLGFGLDSPAGKDAADSAAALLEQGDYGIETYEAIGQLVERQLARPAGGTTGGRYVTLKCLALMRDPALDALVSRTKPSPVGR